MQGVGMAHGHIRFVVHVTEYARVSRSVPCPDAVLCNDANLGAWWYGRPHLDRGQLRRNTLLHYLHHTNLPCLCRLK